MSLELPKLDERTFDDIVREAMRRIPRYTPEWTDLNPSDPGMTLVDLFAWMTETMLWEMNRIPEQTYLALLNLLNIDRKPPIPATAHLTFEPQPAATRCSVPAGTKVAGPSMGSGPAPLFETTAPLDLVCHKLTFLGAFDGAQLSNVTAADGSPHRSFLPFGDKPQVGAALYFGFGAAAPEGETPGAVDFPPQIRIRAFRPAASASGEAQRADLSPGALPSPVHLAWEYQPADGASHWVRLKVYADGTSGFIRDGDIVLEGPGEIVPTLLPAAGPNRHYWLRCRLLDGAYPAGRIPVLSALRFNTVAAVNLETVEHELLGPSNGDPGQSFVLSRKPVQPDSLDLQVRDDDGRAESWQRVDTLYGHPTEARIYTLDPVSGAVTFGDSTTGGAIPDYRADIVAVRYKAGGGASGNLSAGAIAKLKSVVTGIARVSNFRPSVGGRDMETVDEIKAKAPLALRNKERAVTGEDYAALAESAGGVIQAEALPLVSPDYPDMQVPGAVTVLVVPEAAFGTAAEPELPPVPSDDLIAHVGAYLAARRVLTSELYVAGPSFHTIRVEARVIVAPDAAAGIVENDCIAAINRFVAPVLNGDGQRPGTAFPERFKFGRQFYPASIVSVLENVAGVVSAEDITVSLDGVPIAEEHVTAPTTGLFWPVKDHRLHLEPQQFTQPGGR